MLSDGSQRRYDYQSEEIKILNITFPRVGIEPTTHALLYPWVMTDLNSLSHTLLFITNSFLKSLKT